MSGNDEKKAPDSPAPRASAVPPSPTRPPPPPSERKSNTSLPPPPPRRSVKPSGPPPPPPRLPRGQRLAGVFSTPPPPVEPIEPAPVAVPTASPRPSAAPPPLPVEPVAAVPPPPLVAEAPRVPEPPEPQPEHEPSPVVPAAADPSPQASYDPPIPAEPLYAEPPRSAPANEAAVAPAPIAFPTVPLPAFDPLAGAATAGLPEALPSAPIPSPASMPAPPAMHASPSLAARPSLPVAAPAGASLASRVSVAQARVVAAVPPEWLALARRQPVLWMVVIPVTLASLLILLAVAVSPDVETARPEPLTVAPATSAPQVVEPAAAPAPPPPAPDTAHLATLEGKSPDSLSVDEVLVLKAHRAELKRQEAQNAVAKLQQAEAPKDAASQRELLRLASDPDTAELTLSALARASSPAAKDVLYEVWTSRTVPAPLAELAGSLLSSRDVRAGASPALAAALELRMARSCEAVQGALPHARAEGDRRSLAPLGKLASRRGCGADKTEDCYPCLRADMKQVNAAIEAVKRRKAPSFGPN